VVVVVDFVVDGVMVLVLWVVGGGRRVKGEPGVRSGRIGFLLIDSFLFLPFFSFSQGWWSFLVQ
jgi:hypothetical protein